MPALPGGGAVMRNRRRAIGWIVVAAALALVAVARSGGGEASRPAMLRQVVLTARALPAGRPIQAPDLVVRRVPAQAASPHELGDPAAAVGRVPAVALPPRSPLMDAELAAPSTSGRRDVALRLDDLAGVPAGDLAGGRADVYLIQSGRTPRIRRVLANVLVVSAGHSADGSVATLRLAPGLVARAISAEGAGQLRLVSVTSPGTS
jgi:Flp pilus assembly protein CpaB